MNTFSLHVPLGFRFHPTDEELVDYYLRKKINCSVIELDVIRDIDLYKIEPWDLQEVCRLGTGEENDWFFFSHKDKKYPTSSRTNRATLAGFWKATGRDKAIYNSKNHNLVGMRKTLVFYKGRSPSGLKSDWIMHEYRLETDENTTTTQEKEWVVCRVFKKKQPIMMRRSSEHEPMWYDDQQVSFTHEIESPTQNNIRSNLGNIAYQYYYGSSRKVRNHLQNYQITPGQYCFHSNCNSSMPIYGIDTDKGSSHSQSSLLTQDHSNIQQHQGRKCNDQLTDWRVLDKFVTSQLHNQGDASIEENHDQSYPNEETQIVVPEDESISIYNDQIDLWKSPSY